MRKIARAVLGLAAMSLATPVIVDAQAKPVVAVLYFDNNSIGKDRADFDGVGKGIADLLITDMASNANITVVERERVQALLTEQSLTKAGTIDPQTAIRLGKIIGAQYMITGGFMSDGRGNLVLTSRAIDVSTSKIMNPVRLSSKGDDVLGLIAQLSQKLNAEMQLPVMRVGDAAAAPTMTPAVTPAGEPSTVPAATPAPAAEVRHAEHKAEAKPADKPAPRSVQVAESKPRQKMDIKTAMLYSKALEEEDAGNRTRAVELYRQVIAKFPDFPPAKNKIDKLSRG